MKPFIFLLTIICLSVTAKAQFLGGIFSQNSTQRKYMIEQIAALKVYSLYLNKGYDIVKDGTRFISDVKNGEFSLHKDYFHSLALVSPAAKKHPKAAAIYAMQSEMLRDRQNAAPILAKLNPGQAAELGRILSGLQSGASRELDELLLVLQDGNIEMTEDSRIKAIDRIYEKVQQMYAFQKRLLKSTGSLIPSNQQQTTDNALYKQLYR